MALVALHEAYRLESERADETWLVQPFDGGKLRSYTFAQGFDEARKVAAWLRGLDLPENSQIAIFSKNCAWWVLADLAIWMAGHVSVPIYPTLPADEIRYILEHSESKAIFIGKLDGYEAMREGIPETLTRISLPLGPANVDHATSWTSIVHEAEPLQGTPQRDPDELATIIYTSGSTGRPKGVMLDFKAMAASFVGLCELVEVRSDDRMLSYLPLAHGLERFVVETGSLMKGFQLYFTEGLQTFVEDLKRARPTNFVSVPRLWLKFQLGVLAKMPAERLETLLKVPVVRGFVAKKVLAGLGLDQVRFAGTGSAPIPAELVAWYRALGLELLEGYGMTENFSYSHLSRPGEVRVGYVGSPYPGVECRLSDEGEVLVKSPGTMMGYFKDPERTAAAFTEDGFLKTGDRGEIDDKGRLKITGRVKELFKTSKAKYVAPAPIENLLLLDGHVELACVMGSGCASAFGLVMLSDQARAASKGSERDALDAALQERLRQVNGQLAHHEQLAFLVAITEEWTIENGLLTPTLKLKRQRIEERYSPLQDQWFDQAKKIIWE